MFKLNSLIILSVVSYGGCSSEKDLYILQRKYVLYMLEEANTIGNKPMDTPPRIIMSEQYQERGVVS